MVSWWSLFSTALLLLLVESFMSGTRAAEQGANAVQHPKQILRTGVNLKASVLSPNTRQLADILKLTPLLLRIQSLRGRVDLARFQPNEENLASSQQLIAAIVEAELIIQEANLGVDFSLAEIMAEENVYAEVLSSYSNSRDKRIFAANAASYMTNGALWAIGEAYDIPTYKYPRLSIPSGTVSILAGIVPSLASGYTLYALNGPRKTSENDPNMLTKLFDRDVNPEIDYPIPVWEFLNKVPAGDPTGKTRREQLMDRWISDKNIPSFTDRKSADQIDVITASNPHRKGLSISTLGVREVMLQQLAAEILKMKRMLLELAMAVHGEKKV